MAEILNVKNKVLSGSVHRMTSDYGKRYINGKPENHIGVDLVGKNGADWVCAIASGTVVDLRTNIKGTVSDGSNSEGNYVLIDHGNEKITAYFHLEYGTIRVKLGEYVKRGQIIGRTGKTGNATGVHLHFGVGSKKIPRVWEDPKPYLEGKKRIGDSLLADEYLITRKCNFYKKPRIYSGKYSGLKKDTVIVWEKDMGTGWSRVRHNGKRGYVKNSCIGKTGLSRYKVGIVKRDVKLRKGRQVTAETETGIVLTKGTKIRVVSVQGRWCQIKYRVRKKSGNYYVVKSKVKL